MTFVPPKSPKQTQWDRTAERMVENLTTLWVVIRFPRHPRPTDHDTLEVLCWVESEAEAQRIVQELRHGHRATPTLVPRGSYERGFYYIFRRASYRTPAGYDDATQVLERLGSNFLERAKRLEEIAECES